MLGSSRNKTGARSEEGAPPGYTVSRSARYERDLSEDSVLGLAASVRQPRQPVLPDPERQLPASSMASCASRASLRRSTSVPYHKYVELQMNYEFLEGQNAELRTLTQHGEPRRASVSGPVSVRREHSGEDARVRVRVVVEVASLRFQEMSSTSEDVKRPASLSSLHMDDV